MITATRPTCPICTLWYPKGEYDLPFICEQTTHHHILQIVLMPISSTEHSNRVGVWATCGVTASNHVACLLPLNVSVLLHIAVD